MRMPGAKEVTILGRTLKGRMDLIERLIHAITVSLEQAWFLTTDAEKRKYFCQVYNMPDNAAGLIPIPAAVRYWVLTGIMTVINYHWHYISRWSNYKRGAHENLPYRPQFLEFALTNHYHEGRSRIFLPKLQASAISYLSKVIKIPIEILPLI